MDTRKWHVVRAVMRDMADLESAIGNTLAPDDSVGEQLVIWYTRLRAMRSALVKALDRVDITRVRGDDNDAGEP